MRTMNSDSISPSLILADPFTELDGSRRHKSFSTTTRIHNTAATPRFMPRRDSYFYNTSVCSRSYCYLKNALAHNNVVYIYQSRDKSVIIPKDESTATGWYSVYPFVSVRWYNFG